jgi:hypothetical protein
MPAGFTALALRLFDRLASLFDGEMATKAHPSHPPGRLAVGIVAGEISTNGTMVEAAPGKWRLCAFVGADLAVTRTVEGADQCERETTSSAAACQRRLK